MYMCLKNKKKNRMKNDNTDLKKDNRNIAGLLTYMACDVYISLNIGTYVQQSYLYLRIPAVRHKPTLSALHTQKKRPKMYF